MKKCVFSITLGVVACSYLATPAFAIKQFGDAWNEHYVKESENEEFKKAVGEAKCNICHIKGEEKKKHNEYGKHIAEILKKKDFPPDRFKKEPEKCKEEIEEAFKKVEEIKAKDEQTFGDKIKDGKLPAGSVDGK